MIAATARDLAALAIHVVRAHPVGERTGWAVLLTALGRRIDIGVGAQEPFAAACSATPTLTVAEAPLAGWEAGAEPLSCFSFSNAPSPLARAWPALADAAATTAALKSIFLTPSFPMTVPFVFFFRPRGRAL